MNLWSNPRSCATGGIFCGCCFHHISLTVTEAFLAALLFAFCATSVAGEEKPVIRDWTKKGPIRDLGSDGSGEKSTSVSQVEVGSISATVGTVSIQRKTLDGNLRLDNLQVGDKVFVGDQFEVGKSSAVELELGINARLRIGSGSIMRIAGSVTTNPAKDVVSVQRDVELKQGAARVRVRKNTRTPSPVFLISGNMALTVERTDAVVTRAGSENTIMVLKGEADVILKHTEPGQYGTSSMLRIDGKHKIRLPDTIKGELPRPEAMSREEVRDAAGKFSFSIDEERKKLPPPPGQNWELDGP